jgi:hypothetical protein
MFDGVSLAFRGFAPAWLGRFRLSGLIVPCEISWLVVIIVVTLNLFLKGPRGLPGFAVLLYYRPRHLIYLIWMAVLFL